jgi:hypothetical protein
MIQNVLEHMGGIENYGIISMILFVASFLGMLIWVMLLKKPVLKEMSRLPLQPETENSEMESNDHE